MFNLKLQKNVARVLSFVMLANPVLVAAKGLDAIEHQREGKINKVPVPLIDQGFTGRVRASSSANSAEQRTNIPTSALIDQNMINQLEQKQSANGTTVIDIATPTDAGVSHNQFTEFNVGPDGIIFNNSLDPIISALGGWVDGNRRLAGGTASIILAEVTGASSSSLMGYTEILGDSAEFVLANANGITCNGCGFINTPRVTLVTGTPDLLGGQLNGFNISNGQVLFDGDGLNASNVSKFDILTRAMTLNSAIYANDLNIVTGLNYYDYETGSITPVTIDGSNRESGLQYAFDASALGAMYANTIHLVGTEVGLGVRSEGLISSVSDMELTSAGELRLKDVVTNGELRINSQSDFIGTGNVIADSATINLDGQLENQGVLATTGDMTISANGMLQSGTLLAGANLNGENTDEVSEPTLANLSINLSSELENHGIISSSSDIQINAGQLSNAADATIQTGQLNITGGDITNEGLIAANSTQVQAENAFITGTWQAQNFDFILQSLNLNSGTLYQYGELGSFNLNANNVTLAGLLVNESDASIEVVETLNNSGDWLSLASTSLVVNNLINTSNMQFEQSTDFTIASFDNSGQMLFLAETPLTLAINDELVNSGLIQFNSEITNLSARLFDNRDGQLVHLGSGQLTINAAQELNNTQGTISSSSDITINAQSVENDQGSIVAEQLSITANQITNAEGTIASLQESGESLSLTVNDRLDNTSGTIFSSGENLHLASNEIINDEGSISLAGEGKLSIEADQLSNQVGVLVATQDVIVDVEELVNTSGQISGANLELSADSINNSEGQLVAERLSIAAQTLNNAAGVIASTSEQGESLSLDIADTLNNTQEGIIQSAGSNLALEADVINNNGGIINLNSDGELTLNATTINNQAGILQSSGSIISAGEHLNNIEGTISASEVRVNVEELSNEAGVISAEQLQASVESINNTNGVIQTTVGGSLSLVTTNLNNNQGVISGANGTIAIENGVIDNQNGLLAANTIDLQTRGQFNNQNGVIQAENIDLSASSITNVNSSIVASNNLQLTADSLSNSGTSNISGRSVAVSVEDIRNLGESRIQANELTIETSSLTNEGLILATGTEEESLEIDASEITNSGNIEGHGNSLSLIANNIENSGTITHLGEGELDISVARELTNAQGQILSSGNINVESNNILSEQGTIQAAGSINLATQTLVNSGGTIDAGRGLSITAGSLDNQQGSIINREGGSASIQVAEALNNESGQIVLNSFLNSISAAEINNQGTGVISSVGSLTINAQDINNEGSIDANFLIIEGENLSNDGVIDATNLQVTLSQLDNAGSIAANEASIELTTLNNSGLIQVVGSGQEELNFSAEVINNQGQIVTDATNFSLAQAEINNQGGQILHQGSGELTIESDIPLNNQDGQIITEGNLNLTTIELNNERGVIQSSGSATLELESLNNQNGQIVTLGEETAEINVTSTLNNTGGVIQSNSGQLAITTEELLNADGQISVQGQIAIVANEVNNQAGEIRASTVAITTEQLDNNLGSIVATATEQLEGEASLNLTVTTNINNDEGVIYGSGSNSVINADTLSNENGDIRFDGMAEIDVRQLDSSGTITAEQQLSVITDELNNQGIMQAQELSVTTPIINNEGIIEALGTDSDSLELATSELNNSGSVISRGQNLTLENMSIVNQGGTILLSGEGNLTINPTNPLENTGGVIASQGNLNLTTSQLNNQQGHIQANGDTHLTVAELNNTEGVINGGQNLQIDSTNILNSQGEISAESLLLNGETLDNQEGSIIATGEAVNSFELRISQRINNDQGTIVGAGTGAQINTNQLSNNEGAIQLAGTGSLTINAQDIVSSGQIEAAEQLAINTNTLTNDGEIAASEVSVTAQVITSSGEVSAEQLTINTDDLTNSGNIESGNATLNVNNLVNSGDLTASDIEANSLQLNASVLTNSGSIMTNAETLSLNVSTINNTGGQIHHFGDGELNIEVVNELKNITGSILTNGELSLIAQQLDNNEGFIQVAKQAGIDTDSLDNTNGNILALGDSLLRLTVAQLIDNTDGVISAGQIDIDAADLNNTGSIVATSAIENALNISLTNALNNVGGSIETAGESSSITAATITNQDATILHVGSGNFAINAGVLDNQNGEITSNGDTHLTLTTLENAGTIASIGEMGVSASTVNNLAGGTIQGSELTLNTTSINNAGTLQAQNSEIITEQLTNTGSLIVDGNLAIQATAQLNNDEGVIQVAEQLDITAEQMTNIEGQITGTGTESLTINVAQTLNNSEGTIESNSDVATISAQQLTNTNGRIQTLSELNINATNFTNQSGLVAANDANFDVTNLDNQTGGQIAIGNRLDIDAVTLTSDGSIVATEVDIESDAFTQTQNAELIASEADVVIGTLSNQGDISTDFIDITGTELNNSGTIHANQSATFDVAQIDNSGDITSSNNLTIEATQLTNDQGSLSAQVIDITSNTLTNQQGEIVALGDTGESLKLSITNQLTNAEGTIYGAGDLTTISAGTLINSGDIHHNGQELNITADQLNNQGAGEIVAQQNLVIDSTQFTTAGTISANQAELNATNLTNTGSVITEQLNVAATTLNNQGSINSGDITLTGTTITNSGQITGNNGAEQNLEINVDTLNNSGVISSNATDLTLDNLTLNNASGHIEHAGNGQLTLTTNGTLNNQSGALVSNGDIAVTATDLNSNSGVIAAGNNLTVDATQSLTNDSGEISGQVVDLAANSLSNVGGSIAAFANPQDETEKSLTVGVHDSINNQQGMIYGAGGQVSVAANSITNADGNIINAGSGTLTVTANQLTTSGAIASADQLDINADSLNNTGDIEAVTLSIDGTSVDNSGDITADNLTLTTQSTNNSGSIASQTTNLNSNTITNSGAITASGTTGESLQIQSTSLTNTGNIASAGADLRLENMTINNNGGNITHLGAGELTINTSNALQNVAGEILTTGELNIDVDSINNSQGLIQSEQNANITANTLNNQSGSVLTFGNSNLTIDVDQSINNQDGTIGAQQLDITAQQLTNSGGNMLSSDAELNINTLTNDSGSITSDRLEITATNLSNVSGAIAATNGLNIAITESINNTSGQIVTTAANAEISAKNLVNTGGLIEQQAQQSLDINVSETITTSGDISSAGELTLAAQQLTNSGLLSAQNMTLNANAISNTSSGHMQSEQMTITSNTLNNAGVVLAVGTTGESLAISANSGITNTGHIESQGTNLTISDELNNNQGTLVHTGSGQLTLAQVSNNQGVIYANNNLVIDSGDLDNSAGNLLAQNEIDITADQLNNAGGQIRSESDLTINAAGLNNTGGLVSTSGNTNDINVTGTITSGNGGQIIADSQNTSITAGNINLGNGVLATSGNLTLDANQLDNNDGYIGAEAQLNIDVQTVNNNNGAVISAASLDADVTTLNNAGGLVETSDVMDVTAQQVNNQNGLLLSQGSTFELNVSGMLDNSNGGEIEVHSTNLSFTNQELNNQGGTIRHLGTGELNITSNQSFSNQNGALLSNGDIKLALTGNASGTSLDNSSGAIQADGDLTIDAAGGINNTSGVLLAQDELNIEAAALTNDNATLLAGNGLDIGVAGTIQNNAGVIYNHAGAANINADELISSGSITQNASNLTIDVNTLTNSGDIAAASAIDIDANTATNSGVINAANVDVNATASLRNSGHIVANNLDLTTNQLNNTSGVLSAAGTSGESLTINTSNLIDNEAGVIQTSGSSLNLANGVNNTNGAIQLLSNGQLTIGDLDNDGGAVVSVGSINANGDISNASGVIQAGDDLVVNADALNNTSGTIHAGDQVTLTASSLNNNAGRVSSSGSKFDVDVSGTITNTNGLLASSANNMSVEGSALTNAGGSIIHQGNGSLSLDGFSTLNNNSGTVATGGTLELDLTSLTNRSGVLSANRAVLDVDNIDNTSGTIQGQSLDIDTSSLTNNSGLILASGSASNALDINVSGTLNNVGGVLESHGSNMNLSNVGSINNNSGQIRHRGNGTLTISQSGTFNNQSGLVAGQGSLSLSSGNIQNNNGTITANSTNIYSDVNNGSGRLESANNLSINGDLSSSGSTIAGGSITVTNGSVSNSGTLYAINQLDLNVSSLNNSGNLGAGNSVDIDSNSTVTNSGVITASGDVDISGSTVNNSNGAIQARNIDLDANTVRNDNGELAATNIDLAATTLTNSSGTIFANGTLNMGNVNSLDNRNGTLANSATNWSMSLNNVQNSGGRLLHLGSGTLTVSSSGTLANSGTIASEGNLDLSASRVENSGNLQSGKTLSLDGSLTNSSSGLVVARDVEIDAGSSSVVNQGTISTTNSLEIEAGSINNSGILYSQNSATLDANTITNSNTLSASDLDVTGFNTFTNSGVIEAATGNYSGGTLVNTSSGTLVNTGSSLTLNVSQLNNSGILQNSSNNMTFGGNVSNSGQIVHAGNGTLTLGNAGSVDVAGGSIATAGNARLQGSVSGAGTVYAQDGMTIDTSGTFVNTGSTLYTEGDLQINSAVNNQNGRLLTDGDLGINTSGAINNQGGTLQGENLNLTAGSINNSGGGTITSLGNGSGSINVSGTLNNSSGTISSSNGNFTVSAGQFNNNSGTISHSGSGTLTLDSSQIQAGGTSSIKSNGNITLDGSINNAGTVSSKGTLTADAVTNSGTFSSWNSNVAITGNVTNSNKIDGKTGVKISGGTLNNAGGQVQSTNGLVDIDVSSLTTGTILGKQVDVNTSGSLSVNNGDLISASDSVKVNAGGNINLSGTISSSGAIDVDGSRLTVAGSGKLQGGGNVNVDASNINNSGTISSHASLTMNGTTVNNGSIAATSYTQTGKLTNNNLVFAASNMSLGSLDNTDSVYSAGNATINGTVNNTGNISASNNLSISGTVNNNFTGSVSFTDGETTTSTSETGGNRGNIWQTRETNWIVTRTVTTTTTNAAVVSGGQSGTIAAGNDLTLSGTINNNYSTISAGNNIYLSGASLNNRSASNEVITETKVYEDSWTYRCLQWNNFDRVCSEPGDPRQTGTELVSTDSETTFEGGSAGTIAAGGSIIGSFDGEVNTSAASASGRTAGTNASGSAGSGSNGGNTSVSGTSGSAENTDGGQRNASGSSQQDYDASSGNYNVSGSYAGNNNQSSGTSVGSANLSNATNASARDTNDVVAINEDMTNDISSSSSSSQSHNAVDISNRDHLARQDVTDGLDASTGDLNSNGVTLKQGGPADYRNHGPVESVDIELNTIQPVDDNDTVSAMQVSSGGIDVQQTDKPEPIDNIYADYGNRRAIHSEPVKGGNPVQGGGSVDVVNLTPEPGIKEPPLTLGADDDRFVVDKVDGVVQDQGEAIAIDSGPQVTVTGGFYELPDEERIIAATIRSDDRAIEISDSLNMVEAVDATGGLLAGADKSDLYTGEPVSNIDRSISALSGADVNVNGISADNQAPGHGYTTETREEYLTEQGLFNSPEYLESIGHNPDEIIRDMVDEEQGRQQSVEQQRTVMSPPAKSADGYVANQSGIEMSENIFMSEEQYRVLTEDIGFSSEFIDSSMHGLYAAVSQNDLLEDGVTISAQGTVDIRADGGLNLGTGIVGGEGVILRSESDLNVLDGGFFDSEELIGLDFGGDFVNDMDIESNNIWINVGGDFTNNADLTANDAMSLHAGNDFLNMGDVVSGGYLGIEAGNDIVNYSGLYDAGYIEGVDVYLNAGNDIINRTEYEQITDITESDKRGEDTRTYTMVSQSAEIVSHNSLTMEAGNNIDLQGTSLAAATDINLSAGNDVLLGAVEKKFGREEYFKGGYDISSSTTYDVTTLSAGNNISVIAGNNLESEGAQFTANNNVTLAAGNELNLVGVTESHISQTKKTKKRTFSKKVTITESQHDTVHGSSVTAGNNIYINAVETENGLMAQQTGDVNIIGSELFAANDAVISGNDVNIQAQTYVDYESKFVSKKSFGGLKNKAKFDAEKTEKLTGSEITTGGNLSIVSGDDVTVVGSDLLAGGNVNITAFDEVIISAGEETLQEEHMRKSGGFFSGGSVFSSSEKVSGTISTTADSSTVMSGGNIHIDSGSAVVVGSDLIADGSITAQTDIGDIQVLAAKETTESYSSERELEVGFGDVLDVLAKPTDLVKQEDGRIKFTIANASYDSVDTSTSETNHVGSNLSAGENVNLVSVGDILIEGSNLASDSNLDNSGDINLIAEGNVTIQEAENSFDQTTEEVHGSAELSVTVQHQAVEVANSVKALDDAKDQLKTAEQDYRKYQKERDQLESTLAQLEQDYENGVPGVDYQDVLDTRALLDDVKSDEEWYIAGIATASANVVSKSTQLAQQTVAAANSTATYGFNAGLQLDVSAEKTTSDYSETTSLASTLVGQNINIQTGNPFADDDTSTTIQGSHLDAIGEVNINTGTLNVLASKDTSESKTQTESGTLTISQTVWGAAGGPSVNASLNKSEQQDRTTTYNNSTINAGTINVVTDGDTNILGGNLSADNSVNMQVGGDLNLESQQNRYSGSSKGFGISGGFSFGGDTDYNKGTTADNSYNRIGDTSQGVSSANGGLNANNSRYFEKETVVSSITSGGDINIDVAGNTNLVGSVIATLDEEGNDLGNVNLTTNTLTYTNLTDTSYSQDQSIGITANVGISDKQNTANVEESDAGNSLNTSTLTYSNESSYSRDKALATIGGGNLTVGDEENSDELVSLNRDTDNTTKSIFDVDRQQGNIDLTVDHRLLSEEGREQIKKDFVDSYEFGEDIYSAAQTLNESDALALTNFWEALHNNVQATELKNDLLRNEENAHILEGLKSGDGDEYAAAMQELGALAQDKFGIELVDIHLYDGNATDSLALGNSAISDVKGAVVTEEGHENAGEIFLDAGDGASKTDLINTLGHETIEAVTFQNGDANDASQEALANAFGDQFSERIDQAAGGDLDSTGGSDFQDSLRNSNAVAAGTRQSNNVGLADVDYRQLQTAEMQAIKNQAPKMADKLGISVEEAEKRMAVELVRRVDESWSEYYADTAEDPAALTFLAEALVPMGDEYAAQFVGDVPVGDGQEYTAEEVQQLLVNYKDTNSQEFENRTLYGEDLVSDSFIPTEQQTFYTNNLGEEVELSDMGDTLLGAGAGLVDVAGDALEGAVDLAVGLVTDTEGTTGEIAAGIHEDLKDPIGFVEDAMDAHQDSEINGALDRMQGDAFGAARNEMAGDLTLALDTGLVPVGRLPDVTPDGAGAISIDTSSAVKGSTEYDILNNPAAREANTKYELDNGNTFTTNSQGQVEVLTFTPTDTKMPRDSRQTQAGKQGRDTDVGGHAQACSQGGTCDGYNLFPQDSNFNNSAYKSFYENKIKKALADPNQTVGQTTIKFNRLDPASPRPDTLSVTYTINGKVKTVHFDNEPKSPPKED